MKLGRMVGLTIMVMAAATQAMAAGNAQPVKDPDGKTLAVVVSCDSCQSASDGSTKQCHSGVEEGWLNGTPCGKCMLSENAGKPVPYPYDLHFTGKLVDDSGNPMKGRFLKLFLANGWTVRTRTSDQGVFRLMLGATEDRKSKQPLVTDLGTQRDLSTGTEYYALFLLPESYKPCAAQAAGPAAVKERKGKKH